MVFQKPENPGKAPSKYARTAEQSDGYKNSNQSIVDYIIMELDGSIKGAVNKDRGAVRALREWKECYESSKVGAIAGTIVGLGGFSVLLSIGVPLATPIVALSGLAGLLSASFISSHNDGAANCQTELDFLELHPNLLKALAVAEQKGLPSDVALAIYQGCIKKFSLNPGTALPQKVIDQTYADIVNGALTGYQASESSAKAFATGEMLPTGKEPQAEESPWDDDFYEDDDDGDEFDSLGFAVPGFLAPSAEVEQPPKLSEAGALASNIQKSSQPQASVSPAENSVSVAGYPAPPIGVTTVTPADIGNNIDKYPIVMVVAGQGCGKTVTMAAMMDEMSGRKVLSTPKADDHLNAALSGVYDLKFGFDPILRQGAQFGDSISLDYEQNDFDQLLKEGKKDAGSILEFIAAASETVTTRIKRGKRSTDEPWRVFYDEAAQTYTVGYSHLDKKQEERCQDKISRTLKYGLFNFRSSDIQVFMGAQSESVDIVGLKGVAAARDEAWHLYPGRLAVEKARMFGQHSTSVYLERLLASGRAIALLEKQGVKFEVIQLPMLSDLKKYDPIVDAGELSLAPIEVTPNEPIAEPILEASSTPQQRQPANSAEQLQQMLMAAMSSGMLGDVQESIKNQAIDTQHQLKIMMQQFKNLQETITNQNHRIHQIELSTEDDVEYGADDPQESQPVNRVDAMAILKDTLIGLKQESEVLGKTGEPIILTARDFSRKLELKGSEFDGNSTGGSARCRELFQQFAFENSNAYRYTIMYEGTPNESPRLTSFSTNSKSTTTKATKGFGKTR